MKHFIIAVSLMAPLVLWGCGGSAVVATVGDERITQEEFEETYAKNNGGWDAAKASSVEDRQKFLDLLIKFRLKVREARQQGLMQDTSIQNEIESYRSSVSQSYVLEKELIEPGVQRIYDRKKEELRASHVLIRLTPQAPPEDTLKAWEKAQKVLATVPRVPFDTLARAFSEDPSATFNNGDLGWFSVGKMVVEFEDAAYGLKVGEVTKAPVRTQFGYHIIKVTNRQPSKGQARIQHILRRYDPTLSDTAQVRDTANLIYKQLKAGMPWTEAVKKYSQDPNTVERDGEIGLFDRDRLPPQVGALVWSLQKDSVGEPLGFPYGFHILRPAEFLGVPPFEAAEKDIKQLYQSQRYMAENDRFVRSLQTRYHFKFDSSNIRRLAASFDSTKSTADSGWSASVADDFKNNVLFSSDAGPFTVRNFLEKVEPSPEFKTYFLSPPNISFILNRLVEVAAMDIHCRSVSQRYPVFGKLMDEYEDGILLYRIEQDEVWKKVVVNDSLLRIFYDANKEKYRWPDRVNFAEIYVASDSALKEVQWRLAYGEDFKDVAFDYTARPGYKEKSGVWGFQPFTANDLAQKAAVMEVDSVSGPFRNQAGWSVIKALAKEGPRMKTFEEAGPEVASGYQEQASKQRELDWVDALKKKHLVTINNEALAGTFKKK